MILRLLMTTSILLKGRVEEVTWSERTFVPYLWLSCTILHNRFSRSLLIGLHTLRYTKRTKKAEMFTKKQTQYGGDVQSNIQ